MIVSYLRKKNMNLNHWLTDKVGYFNRQKERKIEMILQYSREIDGERLDTIIDGVVSVNEAESKVDVHVEKNERSITKSYSKAENNIFNMYLLNDNFKTLKKLI